MFKIPCNTTCFLFFIINLSPCILFLFLCNVIVLLTSYLHMLSKSRLSIHAVHAVIFPESNKMNVKLPSDCMVLNFNVSE